MDKTDQTNVLVSIFKISSTGMGHFGEMHFSLPVLSLPFDYFDVKDIKMSLRIISFEIIVACPQHYGLTCIFLPKCLIVYKNLHIDLVNALAEIEISFTK